KLPYLKSSNKKLFGGFQYAYLTSNQKDGWHFSSHHISDKNSIFGNTLAAYYANRKGLTSVFYNDQPPTGNAPSSYAHAKGVVVADEKQGFWLIHTIPHFAYSNASVSQGSHNP